MAELATLIAGRIAAADPSWFPGLANQLVADFWVSETGLRLEGYRTAIWLGEPFGGLAEHVPAHAAMIIEPLPPSLARRFSTPDFTTTAPEFARAVAAALARLGSPGPADAISMLVRSIHCVAASRPGYDLSCSDPDIPFSVFLSNPIGERHAELRLAESMLHEAMHLQLTLIEREAPLVGRRPGSGFSPWQARDRPVQGLLHGLYVFTAIHEWLALVAADPSLAREDRIYVDRRLAEIGAEVREVATLASVAELTVLGRALAKFLLGQFADDAVSHSSRSAR